MKFATRLTFLINSCNFSSRLFRAPFLSRLIFKPQCLHLYFFFPAKSGCHQPQRVHVFEVPFSPQPHTIFLPSIFLQCHSSLSANIAGATMSMFFRAVVPKPTCDSSKVYVEWFHGFASFALFLPFLKVRLVRHQRLFHGVHFDCIRYSRPILLHPLLHFCE